jgi:hypothetical protein
VRLLTSTLNGPVTLINQTNNNMHCDNNNMQNNITYIHDTQATTMTTRIIIAAATATVAAA